MPPLLHGPCPSTKHEIKNNALTLPFPLEGALIRGWAHIYFMAIRVAFFEVSDQNG